MPDIILPPMSRRSREILYLLTANANHPFEEFTRGIVIPYEKFLEISPSFERRVNITTALWPVKEILKIYGFYLTAVTNKGYMCHKSILHTPDKFDRKFFGARKIDETTL